MKAVFDTSTLISLELGKVLNKCFGVIDVITVPSVVLELKEIARYNDFVASSAMRILDLINSNKIKVISANKPRKITELLSKYVDAGEAECFVVCLENEISVLITDDVDAAYGLYSKARLKNISVKISAAVIVELFRQSIIGRIEARTALLSIIKSRRWEGGILEVLMRKYFSGL